MSSPVESPNVQPSTESENPPPSINIEEKEKLQPIPEINLNNESNSSNAASSLLSIVAQNISRTSVSTTTLSTSSGGLRDSTSGKKKNPLAGSFEWLVEDDVTCPVCLDIFDDPVTIGCNHNFCDKCAKILIHNKGTDIADFHIVCPLCREVITLGTNKEEITFPRNTRLSDNVRRLKEKESLTKFNEKPETHSHKQTVIPRSIKLLDEYDASIGKGAISYIPNIHTGYIGYGLNEDKAENSDLTHWHGIIIAPQESPIGQLIYNVEVTIPPSYPRDPPEVYFLSPKIAMKCVDEKGKVDISKIELVDIDTVDDTGQVDGPLEGAFYKWEVAHNIADVLVAIRENMHTREVCSDSSCLGSSGYDRNHANPPPEGEEE